MSELLGWIKSWQAITAMVMGGPLAVLIGWWRFRERVWRLTDQRQKALRELLKTRRWDKGDGLELQLSLKQAYGKKMDERDFRFIMRRHDPMTLLEHRFGANDFVRLKPSGDGFEDCRVKLVRWIPMKGLHISFSMLAGFLFLPLFVFVVAAFQSNVVPGTLALLESIALEWVLIFAANKANSACKVLDLEHHPEITQPEVPPSLPESKPDSPSPAKPPRSRSTKPRGKQATSPLIELGPTATPPSNGA